MCVARKAWMTESHVSYNEVIWAKRISGDIDQCNRWMEQKDRCISTGSLKIEGEPQRDGSWLRELEKMQYLPIGKFNESSKSKRTQVSTRKRKIVISVSCGICLWAKCLPQSTGMSDNQLESHGKSECQNCQSAQRQLSVMGVLKVKVAIVK